MARHTRRLFRRVLGMYAHSTCCRDSMSAVVCMLYADICMLYADVCMLYADVWMLCGSTALNLEDSHEFLPSQELERTLNRIILTVASSNAVRPAMPHAHRPPPRSSDTQTRTHAHAHRPPPRSSDTQTRTHAHAHLTYRPSATTGLAHTPLPAHTADGTSARRELQVQRNRLGGGGGHALGGGGGGRDGTRRQAASCLTRTDTRTDTRTNVSRTPHKTPLFGRKLVLEHAAQVLSLFSPSCCMLLLLLLPLLFLATTSAAVVQARSLALPFMRPLLLI
jgi:hypothetical protein